MSNWLIATVWTLALLLYAFGVGVTWMMFDEDKRSAPADPDAILGSLLWPLALPMFCGARFAMWLRRHRVELPRATAREVKP